MRFATHASTHTNAPGGAAIFITRTEVGLQTHVQNAACSAAWFQCRGWCLVSSRSHMSFLDPTKLGSDSPRRQMTGFDSFVQLTRSSCPMELSISVMLSRAVCRLLPMTCGVGVAPFQKATCLGKNEPHGKHRQPWSEYGDIRLGTVGPVLYRSRERSPIQILKYVDVRARFLTNFSASICGRVRAKMRHALTISASHADMCIAFLRHRTYSDNLKT